MWNKSISSYFCFTLFTKIGGSWVSGSYIKSEISVKTGVGDESFVWTKEFEGIYLQY